MNAFLKFMINELVTLDGKRNTGLNYYNHE